MNFFAFKALILRFGSKSHVLQQDLALDYTFFQIHSLKRNSLNNSYVWKKHFTGWGGGSE